MAKYGKWIGAGLGFVMGGPIGALFGYFIGSTFDTATIVTSGPANDPGTRPTGRGDFLLSLVVLATALMKADGKVTRNELDYVKKFFRDNFGLEGEREALDDYQRPIEQRHRGGSSLYPDPHEHERLFPYTIIIFPVRTGAKPTERYVNTKFPCWIK